MRLLRSMLISCVVVFSLLAAYNITQSLDFDFEKEDQAKSWEDLKGKMEIRDGLFCSVNAADGPLVSVISDWKDDWSDYTITVKAQGLVADADWGIAFRVQDISNHYSWQYCNSNLMFVTYVGGTRTEAFTTPQGEVLNEWQDFKVDVKGNSFDLYWNGELKKTVKNDALKTGKAGTFNWINGGTALGKLGGVTFDDFSVEGEGIPSAKLAVKPGNRLAVTWANIKR